MFGLVGGGGGGAAEFLFRSWSLFKNKLCLES